MRLALTSNVFPFSVEQQNTPNMMRGDEMACWERRGTNRESIVLQDGALAEHAAGSVPDVGQHGRLVERLHRVRLAPLAHTPHKTAAALRMQLPRDTWTRLRRTDGLEVQGRRKEKERQSGFDSLFIFLAIQALLHSRSAVLTMAPRRQKASKALDSVICCVAPSLSFHAVIDTNCTPLLKSLMES